MLVWIEYSDKERDLVKAFFYGLDRSSRVLFSGGGIDPKCLYNNFLRWQKDEGRFLLEEWPIKGKKRVITVLTCRGGKTVELTGLSILGEVQGKGLGKSLTYFLNSLLSQMGAEFIVAEVKEENERMLNLLKGLGFSIIGKDEDKGCFRLGKKLDQWPKKAIPNPPKPSSKA